MSETEYYRTVASLFQSGRMSEVIEKLSEAKKLFGPTHEYWFYIGVVAFGEQKYSDALTALTTSNSLRSDDIRVHYNLGVICAQLENYSDAMGWLKKVLAVQPENISVLLMISAIFDVTGNPAASEKTCRIILKLDPKNVSALNNIGNAFKNSGRPQEAADAYRQALLLNPTVDSIISNLLFSLNYAATNGEATRHEHEQLASIWDRPSFVHSHTPQESGKIRIGFVSPDLCYHSVAYFLTGLFTNLNRENFFIASYANVDHPDSLTEWFKSSSDLWRDTNLLSKEQLAQTIYNDRIDVLIDLAGHTGGTNLAAFGYEPAPIQATWLGYPCTTGMKTVHYRITDPVADPIGFEQDYSEQLIRLPHFLNYCPRPDIPECDFTASKERDFILFGSFNNIAKLSPETIRLWGMVLNAVPNSKLLIKHKYFNDPSIQEQFLERFRSSGIDIERLIFKAFSFTDRSHLEEYHQIDIALDSWPYNGTTTTFEAMIMGVPTLTMTGPVHASRVGTMIMTGVGLPDYVTNSPEQFAERAFELTRDRSELLATKAALRNRFLNSPLADSEQFTRNFEQAITTIVKDYREQHS